MNIYVKSFYSSTIRILTLLLMLNVFIENSFAQNIEQEKIRYKVEVDSQIIKATPYEITLKNEEEAIEEKLNMEVLDIMGNVVLKSYIEDGRKQISTSNMQPGKYQIAIYTKDEVVTSSFIVKR